MEEKSLIISQENLIAEAGEFVKGLTLPTNYDYNSATKSFYLQLIETKDMNKKPALEVCTKPSIVNALQTMLNYGLSTEKKQCALIVRGDKLCCHIEYFGWVKKMFLALHNLAVMKKGWLPIHGAMIQMKLHDGSEKNIVVMGDSGAGKSET